MSRPLALDLFCGAGFDVIGVDNRPQPRYPFRFVQGDALRPPFDLGDFDFVWASPVCKRWTDGAQARMGKGVEYPDQIAATRALLSGHPLTAIENVMRAPIRADIVLHGDMFPELKVIRRREMGLPDYTADMTRAAMDCAWMTKAEVCQAIPPAYGEFIGRAALRHMGRQAA